MAQRVEDHVADDGKVAAQRVAAAGVVDEQPRIVGRVAIVGKVVEPAQRQRRAERVALAGVVEDQVEDGSDAGFSQGRDRAAEIGDAARRQARVERHEGHRVVAPGVGQPQRRQVPLVDPGRDGHQFNGVGAEPLQVGDDRGVGQSAQRAALGRRHLRMAHREGAHGKLVDEAAGPEERRGRRFLRNRVRGGDDRLRHEVRRVDPCPARRRERGIMAIRAVYLRRIGIYQELRRVEPEPARRVIRPVGAETIARARTDPGHMQGEDIVFAAPHRQPRGLGPARVEQAELDPLCMMRPDGKQGSGFVGSCAEGCQAWSSMRGGESVRRESSSMVGRGKWTRIPLPRRIRHKCLESTKEILGLSQWFYYRLELAGVELAGC